MPKALVVLPLLLLLGCTADASATGVAPTVPPATLAPSPPASTVGEVRAAYRRSWAVYAAAARQADPSGLDAAFGGPALVLQRRAVAALPGPVRVRVRHHVDVALVDADTALVTDVLEDHGVRRTQASTLRREAGTWLVTEAASL